MRDDRVQLLGSFQSGRPDSKGSVLLHEKLIEFIHRNYQADAQGRWYFQNGPQKVFVELEATPYILRLNEKFEISTHTGQPTQGIQCLVDEAGRVYFQTPLGLGLVHTMDVGWVAEAIEKGVWAPENCLAKDLPERFEFVISPQQHLTA